MLFDNINEDLRTVKTEKALHDAMFSLLKSCNFKNITVKEICEKALISRAAFYAHFIDKYDLLKQRIMKMWLEDYDKTYEGLEQMFSNNMHEKRRILKNIIYYADKETIAMISDFLLSTKYLNIDKNCDKNEYQHNIVLSNFYAGGIISYLRWQVDNNFPPDVPLINKDFYNMVRDFKINNQK